MSPLRAGASTGLWALAGTTRATCAVSRLCLKTGRRTQFRIVSHSNSNITQAAVHAFVIKATHSSKKEIQHLRKWVKFMAKRLALGSQGLLIVLALCFASLPPASATLGEDVSSIESDQAHFKAIAQTITRQLYSVQQMQTASGTTIRQYVSPAGTVFAVSWRGAAPDLQQLLGTYFDQYVALADRQSSRRGRGVRIDNGDLVIETGGHMGYVTGRAYLRSKMPQGVADDEIR